MSGFNVQLLELLHLYSLASFPGARINNININTTEKVFTIFIVIPAIASPFPLSLLSLICDKATKHKIDPIIIEKNDVIRPIILRIFILSFFIFYLTTFNNRIS